MGLRQNLYNLYILGRYKEKTLSKSMSNSFTTFSSAIAAPKTWLWKGFPICYQVVGNTGPAVVLVHGFGASWGHWRKNLPVLGETCRCYAIDLIGASAVLGVSPMNNWRGDK